MRLIALLLLSLPVVAQETFRDADFEFSIKVPAGMERVPADVLAAVTQRPLEMFANPPRAESPDGVAVHEHHWRDLTGHRRQLTIALSDLVAGEGEIVPNLDAWAATVESQFGVTIAAADREPIRRGPLVLGYRVTADKLGPDGALKRATYCYMPLLVGHATHRDRVGTISFDALKVDWERYEAEFDAMLESMEYPLPRISGGPAGAGGTLPGEQAAAPGAGNRGGQGGQGARRAKGESWGSLQVTGSLLLALVLFGSLFVGGAGGKGGA